MKYRISPKLTPAIALLAPSIAFANAGTPLIWLSMLHLAFGNMIIGIIEGYVISKIFKTTRLRTVAIMIVANYFSAAVGAGLLWQINSITSEGILYFVFTHFTLSLIGIIGGLVLLTILLEQPFCYLILKGSSSRARSAFRASIIVHVFSYLLISPFYFLASKGQISPPWKIEKVGAAKNLKGHVSFINFDETIIQKLQLTDFAQRISAPAKDVNKNYAEKCLSRESIDYSNHSSQWKVDWIGTWAIEGFSFVQKDDPKKKLGMAVESPPFWWSARCATLLPGDQVVLQFGPFILFLDLNNHIAYPIGIGKLPMVVLEQE